MSKKELLYLLPLKNAPRHKSLKRRPKITILMYILSRSGDIMQKGFTLLEMLVVVMIIGILTAVAVPQYSRSVRRAEMVEGLANGKTIYDAALRYKSVNGEAPTDFNQLDVGFAGTTIEGASFVDGNFTYTLGNTYTGVKGNLGGYDLYMDFPTFSDTGVSAPIRCCPSNSLGTWLCKNLSGNKTSGDCYVLE